MADDRSVVSESWLMPGTRRVSYSLPISAHEYERRLEALLAESPGRPFSDTLSFTGRVAGGVVRLHVRRLSRRSLRVTVEGRFVGTADGVEFRGRAVAPLEVFLPLVLLPVGIVATWASEPAPLVHNVWVGLGCFAIVAVAWHLYFVVRLGERAEQVLRELGM